AGTSGQGRAHSPDSTDQQQVSRSGRRPQLEQKRPLIRFTPFLGRRPGTVQRSPPHRESHHGRASVVAIGSPLPPPEEGSYTPKGVAHPLPYYRFPSGHASPCQQEI